MRAGRFSFLLPAFTVFIHIGFAQNSSADTSAYKTIAAGPEYKRSNFHQWLWGKNRRDEWTTPINVPVLRLDSLSKGFELYTSGGGNETKVIRLRTADKREYTLRSINKSRKEVIPEEYEGTFIEDVTNDAISMSHPYGAFALPVMEERAGIYHTEPKLVYLARQPALDTLNKKYGDKLYLFEQHLSDDWSNADNLGNFKDFESTPDVIDKVIDNRDNKIDQFSFVKARLFDFLIGDWDRHEDQWKWGEGGTADKIYYRPVPRDRDQAFFTHNGILADNVIAAGGYKFMQNFDYNLKSAKTLSFEDRNMDRFFTNEMELDDWKRAAEYLQEVLSDEVIERSIKELPPEIFAISGNELIEKLKSRREKLVKYATDYYLFLAREVEVVGSNERDYFEVMSTRDNEITVKVFSIDNAGKINELPFYSRSFKPSETKEIRLFGEKGEDSYSIDGNMNSIKLVIIGGPGYDSVIQHSGKSKIHLYDDKHNFFNTRHATRHHSPDSTTLRFNYRGHLYDKKGFKPSIFYSHDDRLFVGLGYGFTKHKWGRNPFASKQLIDLHYSLFQKAFSITYEADFPHLINRWNLSLLGIYDAVRWTNFYGLGNETKLTTNSVTFFRMRTREWFGHADINKQFGRSTIYIGGFFTTIHCPE